MADVRTEITAILSGKNNFKILKLMLDKLEMFVIITKSVAGVAHPVERHLAKVEVASSSLVTRSIEKADCLRNRLFQLYSPFGEFYCCRSDIGFASDIALRAVDRRI